MGIFSHLFTLLMASHTSNHTYSLIKKYDSSNFFDQFIFITANDPGQGYVNWPDNDTALNRGLAGVSTDGRVILQADSTNNAQGPGRDSIWVQSQDTFNAGTLVVVDLQSMPGNVCGAWTKLFTSNVDLNPFHAYIDILQTSSLIPQNLIALRTDPFQTCHFSAPGAGSTQPIDNQLGTSASSNCSDGTIGCEVQGLQGDVGDGLNVGGGGIYAMAWEYDSIRIWRFFRKDVPKELNDTNTSVLDVGRWDTPIANFCYNSTDDNCDILGIFRNQALNFKMGFCGQANWWEANNCIDVTKYPNCEDWVRDNPSVFGKMKYEINSVRIYGH